MKISVITVCKNSESTIEAALQSLVNQTAFEFVEYIIIDGASTDNTANVINRYRDKIGYFVSESDTGIYNAMNKGIRLATGDYILFLNSDDILYNPYVIQSFLDFARNNFDWLYIGRIELNPPEIKGHISHSEKY